MKIAITGHTSGLGKSIYNYSIEQNINAIGFSRSNGFNITDSKDRKLLINSVANCDVFINNAYDRYGQLDLLYELYDEWKTSSKLIVSIGSMAGNAAEWRLRPCIYSTIKKALDVATYQLINSHDRQGCKLMVFKPGYLGDDPGKISYAYAAKFLVDAIQNNQYEITELVLRP
jgi:hypothetical protein